MTKSGNPRPQTLYNSKHVFIFWSSKRPQQGAVGGRGVHGARSSPAMFRKKAKGKDDPPAQPRVSDEYGESSQGRFRWRYASSGSARRRYFSS